MYISQEALAGLHGVIVGVFVFWFVCLSECFFDWLNEKRLSLKSDRERKNKSND